MIVQKLYRYMGANGILDSLIYLPDIPHLLHYRLIADEGKVLKHINSNYKIHCIDVNTEEEILNWKEINEGQE